MSPSALLSPMSTKPIRDMFDALVPEYDRFNRLSSLGLDVLWRREVASMFPKGAYVLDVGTGTGDLAKELINHGCRVMGVDFSANMFYKYIHFCECQNGLPYSPKMFAVRRDTIVHLSRR